jgi:hypothetical protein
MRGAGAIVAGVFVTAGVIGGIAYLASHAPAVPSHVPRRKGAAAPKAAPGKAPRGAAPPPGKTPGMVTLTQGKSYEAELTLTDVQQMATNQMVIENLQKQVGPWKELAVTGQGSVRHAHGTYSGKTRAVKLPPQVTRFAEVHAATVVAPSSVPAHAVKLLPGAAAPAAAHVPAAHAAPAAAAAPLPAPLPAREAPPAPPGTPGEPEPLPVKRTAKQAASDLYDYVTARVRAGHGGELGTKSSRNEIVHKAQADMGGAKLSAALARGEGGIYGPLTRTRGKELLGREFPKGDSQNISG